MGRSQLSNQIDTFVAHVGEWMHWYKLGKVADPELRLDMVRRLLEDLGGRGYTELPDPEACSPKIEEYEVGDWLCEHGPPLAESLEQHDIDATGVLEIIHRAGRSGGGPQFLRDSWGDIKVALQQAAIRLRLPTQDDGGTPSVAPQKVTMTVQEAADYVGVSEPTMRTWINDKIYAEPASGTNYELLQQELDTHKAAQTAKKARLTKD